QVRYLHDACAAEYVQRVVCEFTFADVAVDPVVAAGLGEVIGKESSIAYDPSQSDGTTHSKSLPPELPEDDVQNDKRSADDARPERGTLPHRQVAFARNLGAAVDEADEFRFRFGLGHAAHHDGDERADEAAPQSAEHVFGHVPGVGRERDVLDRAMI